MQFMQNVFQEKKELLKLLTVFITSVVCAYALSYFLLYAPQAKAINTDNSIKSGIAREMIIPDLKNGDYIADIVEEVFPSVVHISTETEVKVKTFDPRGFFFEDDFFKDFFGANPFNTPQKEIPFTQSATGSGVIISSDGYILTNYHVVGKASKITVKTHDGKEYDAKLMGKDQYSDLAVIKVNQKGLKSAKLADSDELRPGQWAIAVGSPHGLNNTVTLGIISAIKRNIPELSNVSFIQTDAAINPGNSGGPLMNIKGEVVGINTAIMGTAQNIGFAIPINTAKNVVDELKAGKTIGHPWIGIAMSEITDELSEALGVSKDTKGVVIVKIVPESPAHKSGLQRGDIIQKIDGQTILKPDEIKNYIKGQKVGKSVNVQFLRDNTMMAKKVKLSSWGE